MNPGRAAQKSVPLSFFCLEKMPQIVLSRTLVSNHRTETVLHSL